MIGPFSWRRGAVDSRFLRLMLDSTVKSLFLGKSPHVGLVQKNLPPALVCQCLPSGKDLEFWTSGWKCSLWFLSWSFLSRCHLIFPASQPEGTPSPAMQYFLAFVREENVLHLEVVIQGAISNLADFMWDQFCAKPPHTWKKGKKNPNPKICLQRGNFLTG